MLTRIEQRKPNRVTRILTTCLLVVPLAALPVPGQETRELNVEATVDVQTTLREILETLKRQQAQIDELRAALQQQQETIQAQQKIIDQQQQDLTSQREEIGRASAGGGLDAVVQYKVAMELQHIAIFDVRRREQPAYFRRCIDEFRKIVTDWPASTQAPEAQYRIGKIYHRYLKEYDNAVREYETLLQNYPDSEFVPEAQDAIRDLRGR